MTVYYDTTPPPVPAECEFCGRDSGHHLGCRAALVQHAVNLIQPEEDEVSAEEVDTTEIPVCLAEGCQDAPKPYGGRGPRPKYCAAHGK